MCSSSRRTERLPSPAEISPRAPRRRPAATIGQRPHPISSTAGIATAAARRRARASRTIPWCLAPAVDSLPPRPRYPLARNRDFKVLLTSQGVSALGDAVSFTALPLLVLALTGSGLAMGIVGALQTIPDLVFGMVAGRPRRPDRPPADDVARRPRPGGADRADPVVGAARRADDGRRPARRRPDERAALAVPRGVHRLGAGPRRALAGRPRELDLRGDLLARLHRRPGRRRPPLRGDRARARRWPSTRSRSRCRRSPCSSSGATCAPRSTGRPPHRRGHPRGHRVHRPATRCCAAIDPLLGPRSRSRLAPLVTALAVHVTRDLGLDDSILGLLLTAYGVGTVIGALLTRADWPGAGSRRSCSVARATTGVAAGRLALDPVECR